MVTATKTPKSKLTRTKILQAARDVLTTKPFSSTSVKDIMTQAGMGYGTFYLYFKDKKDLFSALLEEVEGELFTASDGGEDLSKDYARGRSSYRALRRDLKAILFSLKKHKSTLRISNELSVTDDHFKAKYSDMRQRLISRTKEILQKSQLDNIDLTVAAVAISGMIEAVATETNYGEPINIDEVLPTLTKLYFKAVS